MKILFISPIPVEGAGCRFRVYQYLPYLRKHDIRVASSPFLFSSYFRIVYKPGRVILKIIYFFLSTLRRFCDLIRALGYDIIFIYREAYPIGPPVFESILHFLGKSIIFDFDDAIFLPNTSQVNRFLRLLRPHRNADKIISLSKGVIIGNNYLKDYALRFNKNIFVLPTAVDTNQYVPIPKSNQDMSGKVIIGWIGSHTTQDYVKGFIPIFVKLNERYKNLFLKIIGTNFRYAEDFGDNVELKDWSLANELEDLQSFNIGIMPMPDNSWTRGKCGFKAILCMSVGIPVVCSRVGVNTEIVQDGVNGFLVDSQREWCEKLSLLIENQDLRRSFGIAGRQTVEKKFSLEVNAPKILSILKSVYQNDGK